MIKRLQRVVRELTRAGVLWVIMAVSSVVLTAGLMVLAALIANSGGTVLMPGYLLLLPAAPVLLAYVIFALLRGFWQNMPNFLNRGWLPLLLAVLGVIGFGFYTILTSGITGSYLRSAADMSALPLYILQGLVVVLTVAAESLAGVWRSENRAPGN